MDFGRHDNGRCEKRLLTLGLALALAGGASDSGGAPISFAAHQRIVYSDGLHNENTEMIGLHRRILLVFRGGEEGQIGSARARIKIFESRDHGRTFAALSELNANDLPGDRDIRDPKLVEMGGRLFLFATSRLPGFHYRDLFGQAWTVRAESTPLVPSRRSTRMTIGWRLYSCDDHLDLWNLPRDVWEDRLPARFRERGPRVVEAGDRAWWTCDGAAMGPFGTSLIRDYSAITRAGIEDDGFRAARPALRLQDMDRDGIFASVIYGPNLFGLPIDDPELKAAALGAYNDWALEFNRHDPERLCVLPVLPTHAPEAAIAELERVARLGQARRSETTVDTAVVSCVLTSRDGSASRVPAPA